MRKSKLAQIHIAKAQLAMDDDSYRAMLKRVAGADSAKELPDWKLDNVIKELKRLGFKSAVTKQNRTLADDAQSSMIRGLWLELSDMGVVRNRSEEALARYVKRMAKVDALQWLSTKQASNIIESLKAWIEREALKNKGEP